MATTDSDEMFSKVESWYEGPVTARWIRLAQFLLRPMIFNSIAFVLYWGFVALLVWWFW